MPVFKQLDRWVIFVGRRDFRDAGEGKIHRVLTEILREVLSSSGRRCDPIVTSSRADISGRNVGEYQTVAAARTPEASRIIDSGCEVCQG